jgi:TPR repeat protein
VESGELDRLRQEAESGDSHAIREFAERLAGEGDVEGAKEWYLRSANNGDPQSMNILGIYLAQQGDLDGAEDWYRRAMDLGLSASMVNLGQLLAKRGDLADAEILYRRGADAGNKLAMGRLADLLRENGDLDGAESWYRRSAEAGLPQSMNNLGLLLKIRGDLEGATTWFRRALDAGASSAADQLGWLLNQGGDPAGAIEVFRVGADAGRPISMSGLGVLLSVAGDAEEAETWLRRGADTGDTYAMGNLGAFLIQKGEREEAETCFRRAAENGNLKAMVDLGHVLLDNGDLKGARAWYEQAARHGDAKAIEALALVKKKFEITDRWLEVIGFETFGWPMTQNDDGFRRWTGDSNASLKEQFHSFPLPLPSSLDPGDIRQSFMELQGLAESPSFTIDDLDIPEQMRKHVPAELPEQISLLEISVFEIDAARCVFTIIRHRAHEHVHYSASFTLPFAERWWLLGLEVHEDQSQTGEREAAVARHLLNSHATADVPLETFDPYDRQWDGIDDPALDPLTRLRVLAIRLRDSIQIRILPGESNRLSRPED